MRSSPLLPSLPALRAFAAVGRLGSFRRAGEELLITQSAVSHHIRVLETALGLRLFDRHARTISLTPVGERYLDRVSAAFAMIEEATASATAAIGLQRVVVSLLPSFAATWLLPRLAQFRSDHPTIDLVLDPTLRLVDLAGGEADLAIRYGDGSWTGCTAELLMSEQLAPVGSPAFAERAGIADPGDVLGHLWLHTRSNVDWHIWEEAVGIDSRRAQHLALADYNIVLQAAIDGQGIAMGRLRQIASKIESGALVVVSAPVVEYTGIGHWLLLPERRGLSQPAALFAAWLRQEVQKSISD
ncbi:MAG: LysR family transcriptional regulator [Sphingomonas sp.]|nr:LysR family transcriptional regulator [Sphingomonas sp.]